MISTVTIQVKITDMAGKTIQNIVTFAESQFMVDISHFAKGIYLLSIGNEQGTVVRKIIKQ